MKFNVSGAAALPTVKRGRPAPDSAQVQEVVPFIMSLNQGQQYVLPLQLEGDTLKNAIRVIVWAGKIANAIVVVNKALTNDTQVVFRLVKKREVKNDETVDATVKPIVITKRVKA
jgi:hypothetical protein